jgi:hypothetical protein
MYGLDALIIKYLREKKKKIEIKKDKLRMLDEMMYADYY